MAGRFPLYTDADVRGRYVSALRLAGWDILRAIDLYPERTLDHLHFKRAALEKRVLVANDSDMLVLAELAVARGERFCGLVWWHRSLEYKLSGGQFVERFEELAAEDVPFAYPIRILSSRG